MTEYVICASCRVNVFLLHYTEYIWLRSLYEDLFIITLKCVITRVQFFVDTRHVVYSLKVNK